MADRKRPAEPSGSESPATSFEAALERLDVIVDELEGGELTLEQSIARYEEGIMLSRQLAQKLDEAEKRIERLVESEGAPVTEPMELDERADPEGRLPL